MAEVMNRAARRAANRGTEKTNIRVSSGVEIVPMEHAETYFLYEVLRDGPDESLVIPLFPIAEGASPVTPEWFARTLEQMRNLRTDYPPPLIELPSVGPIDIGMIDIQVEFLGPPDKLRLMLQQKARQFTSENWQHLSLLIPGCIDSHMVMTTTCHLHRSDGSFRLHYHNVIFGLQRRMQEGRPIISPFNMMPLLELLKKKRHFYVIQGLNPPGHARGLDGRKTSG